MTETTTYEIAIRGRANPRLLRPLLDDFTLTHSGDHTGHGITRLTGEIRDAAHLHGVVAHLTAVSVELISITPITPITPITSDISVTQSTQPSSTTQQERNETS